MRAFEVCPRSARARRTLLYNTLGCIWIDNEEGCYVRDRALTLPDCAFPLPLLVVPDSLSRNQAQGSRASTRHRTQLQGHMVTRRNPSDWITTVSLVNLWPPAGRAPSAGQQPRPLMHQAGSDSRPACPACLGTPGKARICGTYASVDSTASKAQGVSCCEEYVRRWLRQVASRASRVQSVAVHVGSPVSRRSRGPTPNTASL